MEHIVTFLDKVTLTATACKFVFKSSQIDYVGRLI